MSFKLTILLSIPKSFYVSARLTSFRSAFKLPCFVRYNVRLKSLKGRMVVDGNCRKGLFKFGFGDIGIFDEKCDRSILEVNGTLALKGCVNIGLGSRISIGPVGVLTIGDGLNITAATTIVCFNSISIGDGCLISWQTIIMDTDFHQSSQNSSSEGKIVGC